MSFDWRWGKADFSMWDELELYRLSGHKPKVLERKLIEAAKAFVPYRLYWQGGSCLVDASYGNYIWHFAVEIEQEKRWNFPEFQAGRQFGRTVDTWWRDGNKGSPRDQNPYPHERARHRSWDCGYILGLSERVTEDSTR